MEKVQSDNNYARWNARLMASEQILSPTWHNDLLTEREQYICVGKAVFEDWGAAKKKIRESI